MAWHFDPRKIPIIGEDISQIGQVYDIVTMPCQPTAEIWVLAFWHGTPTLVWSLFKPDVLDDRYDRFQRPHKKRKKGKFVRGGSIPATPPLPKGLGWAKFTADLLQRIGWWFLIVDAATDFAVHWTSTAMQWTGCTVPGHPYYKSAANSGVGLQAGLWGRVTTHTTIRHIFTGGAGEIAIPGGYNASFSLSVQNNPAGFFKGPIMGTRLRDLATGQILAQEPGGPVDLNGRNSSTIVYRGWGDIGRPKRVVAEFQAGPPITQQGPARFDAYGQQSAALLPWEK